MRRLIDESDIRQAVDELGRQIAQEYSGRPLTVLGVLTGSIVFVADLVRVIDLPLRIGLIQASSYRGRSTTPGELSINAELLPDIAGRDVLLVDDIFDTGRTLAAAVNELGRHGPNSIRSTVLLWKQGRSTVDFVPDFHGFTIPDVFVVGYGLDYNDEHRHLPFIAVLEDFEL